MIRKVVSLLYVILFVWAGMILGLLIIGYFIVPLGLPGVSPIVDGVLKVMFSSALALFWLWTWRQIVRRMFWRDIRKQQIHADEASDKKREA